MWNDTDKSMYAKECKLSVRFSYKVIDATKFSSKMNCGLRGSVKAKIGANVQSRRFITLKNYVRSGFLWNAGQRRIEID